MSDGIRAEDQRAAAVPAEVPAEVVAAWARITASWEDQAQHDALIGLVAQHGCFAWAAARYRERVDDPIAKRQQERLRKAATATMLATATVRTGPEEQPYRATILVFVVLLVALAAGGLYALHQQAQAPLAPPPPTTSPPR